MSRHGLTGYDNVHGKPGYALAPSPPTYFCGHPTLPTGLAHLWTFDEFSGKDFVGGANLTRSNNYVYYDDPPHAIPPYKAFVLADSPGSLILPSPVSEWELTGDRTWVWWAIRPNIATWRLALIRYDVLNIGWEILVTTAGNVSGNFGLVGGGSDTLGPLVTGMAAGWHLFVFRHELSGPNVTLSVDGSATFVTKTLAAPVLSGGGETFDKQIYRFLHPARSGDEVAMWNRLLTDAEIDFLWSGGSGVFGLMDPGDCPA